MASRVYRDNLQHSSSPFGESRIMDMTARQPLFDQIYAPVLGELRDLILKRMAKPPEVLVRIN